MKRISIFTIFLIICTFQLGSAVAVKHHSVVKQQAAAKSQTSMGKYYGDGLCNVPGYSCITVKSGDTWQKLFPDEDQRDIVQRVNRTDTRLRPGTVLAVPYNLPNISLLDISPFPAVITPSKNKLIIVDQDRLAWGAYHRDGTLVKWGPISSGRDYCPDVGRACKSITGEFYVYNKKDKRCKSNIFPVGAGGAIMPWCMFFYKGFALHGSLEVVGYRDSHGCVRLFSRDAEWLNLHFVELPQPKNSMLGTKVVVEKLLLAN